MVPHLCFVLAFCSSFGALITDAVVAAQDAPGAPPPQAPPTGYPPPEAAPTSAYPAPASAAPPGTFDVSLEQEYLLKIDLQVELPIPLTDEGDSADPGFGFSGLFGWDLGFLLPSLGLGWSWNGLNLPGDDRTLTRYHLSLGLMTEFENDSIVVPVLGAMLDLNWWHLSGDVDVACGGYYYWGCYAYDAYDYTTGFTFRAGVDLRFLKNERLSLGAGVQPSVTLSGGPFRDAEWWITPYAVFTIRS
jgi:hypothetical protein